MCHIFIKCYTHEVIWSKQRIHGRLWELQPGGCSPGWWWWGHQSVKLWSANRNNVIKQIPSMRDKPKGKELKVYECPFMSCCALTQSSNPSPTTEKWPMWYGQKAVGEGKTEVRVKLIFWSSVWEGKQDCLFITELQWQSCSYCNTLVLGSFSKKMTLSMPSLHSKFNLPKTRMKSVLRDTTQKTCS